MNAAEIQDILRAGDHFLLDRIRRIGGGVLRGEDDYRGKMSDEFDARTHYRVEQRNGTPTRFVTGSCAEFHWPELLDRIEERIYIDTLGIFGSQGGRDAPVPDSEGILHPCAGVFAGEAIYLKAGLTPVFGVRLYWYRFEFAK